MRCYEIRFARAPTPDGRCGHLPGTDLLAISTVGCRASRLDNFHAMRARVVRQRRLTTQERMPGTYLRATTTNRLA